LKIEDQTVTESEVVVAFFNVLFNGYHDINLVDTDSPFCPDFSNLDTYLDALINWPNDVSNGLTASIEMDELGI